jgi:acetolactate synthase small subunit
VWAVLDYTDTNCIQRELLLAKVSILGPDYVEDQYHGGPTHEPRRKIEREANLVHQFERSAQTQSPPAEPETASSLAPLTPTELLRLRNEHLRSIHVLAEQFGARLVDVSENSVIVEISGKTSKVEAFLALLKPYGLLESARTGEYLCLCAAYFPCSYILKVSWPCHVRHSRLPRMQRKQQIRAVLLMLVCSLLVKTLPLNSPSCIKKYVRLRFITTWIHHRYRISMNDSEKPKCEKLRNRQTK